MQLPELPGLTLGGVGVLVLVWVLVAVARKTGLPSRWLPLTSVTLGVLLGLAAWAADGVTLAAALTGGVLIGWSVNGANETVSRSLLGK